MHLCSWVHWSTLAIWVHYSQHFSFPEAFLFQKQSSFPKAIIFSKSFPFSKQIPLGPCFWIKTFLEKNAFKKEYFWKRMYLKCLEKSVIQFNPIPTRLCHVIYCHGDKSYLCLVGLELRKPSIFFCWHCWNMYEPNFWSVAKAELRIWCATWNLNLESYLVYIP